MSQSQQSESDQSGNQRYTRQPAVRATAEELNQAKDNFKKSQAERAPTFQLLPTGVGANRALVAGTLTEVEDMSTEEDNSYLRGKVVAETGTMYVYAGQYSEEGRSFLQGAETPQHVAVCGKMDFYARDEEAEVGERNVSLKPEWIQSISEGRRDEILLENAMATIERADGAANDALVERAEEVYKFDEEFEPESYRPNAVEAIERIDGFYEGEEESEEESEVEEEEPVPA